MSSTLLIGGDGRPLPGVCVLDPGSFSYAVGPDETRIYANSGGTGGGGTGGTAWASISGKPAPLDDDVQVGRIVVADGSGNISVAGVDATGDIVTAGSLTVGDRVVFPGGHYISREVGGSATDWEFWHGGGFDVPNVKLASGSNVLHAVQADANALVLWQSHVSTFPLLHLYMEPGSTGNYMQVTDGLTMPFQIRYDGRMLASTQRAAAFGSDSNIVSMAEFTVDAIPTTATTDQWIGGRFSAWAKPTGVGAMYATIGIAGEAFLKPEANNANVGAFVGTFMAATNQNTTVTVATAYGGYGVTRDQAGGGFTTGYGLFGIAQTTVGAIGTAIGVSGGVSVSGTGAITTAYALHARAPVGAPGTAIGLYVEDQATYAIYTNAGEVYIGGLLRPAGGFLLPAGSGATFQGDATFEGVLSIVSTLSLGSAINWAGGFSTPFIDLPSGMVMIPNLDADKLDGYEATAFARLAAPTNAFTGAVSVAGTTTLGTVAGSGSYTLTSASAVFGIRTTGDGNDRWRVNQAGVQTWSDGTTNLFTATAVAASGTTIAHLTFGSGGLRTARLGVGVAPNTLYGLRIDSAQQGGTNLYHLFADGTFAHDGTTTPTTLRAGYFRVNASNHASWTTVTEITGVRIAKPTTGAALLTASNVYGLYIEDQTISGTTATNLFQFYSAGTGPSLFLGRLGIGTAAADNRWLNIQGALTSTNTTQYGILLEPTVSSSATAEINAFRLRVVLPNGLANTNTYLHNIIAPSMGTGATIGTLYGLKVAPLTQGTTNYAIYTEQGLIRLGGETRLGDNATAAVDETALLIMTNAGGVSSVRRVSVGAADSGGAGFRYLRVPN